MSPKWIALIVVGALLVLSGGGIAYQNYRNWNDLEWLKQRRNKIISQIQEYETDSANYYSAYLNTQSKTYKEKYDKICNTLQQERNNWRELDEKIALIENEQNDKSVDSKSKDNSTQQHNNGGWFKNFLKKLSNDKEKIKETKQNNSVGKDLTFVSYE